ncbi:ComF family protein [Lactobacillus kullabergensis]|nr:ComF family protein [Lactobacillus kullabergensis]
MIRCLLCGQLFVAKVSFIQLFSWHKQETKCICSNCQSKYMRIPDKHCPNCFGKLSQNKFCLDCFNWQKIYGKKLLKNHSLYLYNEAFHDLMVNYKRYGDYALHKVLEELCREDLTKRQADLYVPVPTSPEHLEQRQFDTISSIYSNLVSLTCVLGKKAGLSAQGEKNRAERLRSEQSFFVKKNFTINLKKYKILLLDDIYTTGRTLYHARDALAEVFPNAKISSFTLCR